MSVSQKYLALIKSFPLRRIRSEGELDKATAVMRELTRHGFSRLTAAESDYLEILGNLIDGTQAEYVRIPFADTSLYSIPAGADEESLRSGNQVLRTDSSPRGAGLRMTGVRQGGPQNDRRKEIVRESLKAPGPFTS